MPNVNIKRVTVFIFISISSVMIANSEWQKIEKDCQNGLKKIIIVSQIAEQRTENVITPFRS